MPPYMWLILLSSSGRCGEGETERSGEFLAPSALGCLHFLLGSPQVAPAVATMALGLVWSPQLWGGIQVTLPGPPPLSAHVPPSPPPHPTFPTQYFPKTCFTHCCLVGDPTRAQTLRGAWIPSSCLCQPQPGLRPHGSGPDSVGPRQQDPELFQVRAFPMTFKT